MSSTDRGIRNIIRKTYRYNFLIILFGTYVTLSGFIVDGIMISRYLGETAVTSYGLVMSVYLLLIAFAGILSAGGESVAGQALGIGNIEEANRLFAIVNKAVLILSVILIAAALIFENRILDLLGVPENAGQLYQMSRDYLRGLIIGFPSILWSSTLLNFLALDSDAVRGFMAILFSTLTNIAGDYLCLFAFDGSLFGMALATSVSYYVSCLIVVPHFLGSKYALKIYTPQSGMKDLSRIIKAGMPTGLSRGMVALQTIGLNLILLEAGSETAVAALTVGSSLENFYSPLTVATGMVTLMMSSAFLKEEDAGTLSHILRTMGFYCLGPVLAVAVVLVFFSGQLTTLYLTPGTALFSQALFCVICMAAPLPLKALNAGMQNYLQGIGRYRAASVFSVLDSGGVTLMLAFILGKTAGVRGVWIAFPVSEVLVLLGYVVYSAYLQKRFPRALRDFLFLDRDFGVPAEDKAEYSLLSMEQVLDCSESVRLLCLEKGRSRRDATLMALVVEELGGNIIRWGFADGKEHNINLRLTFRDGGLSLRIRDDCIPFDPQKQAEMYRTQQGVSNYGLRMIYEMVKEMKYVNMMKMNILFINM